MSNKLYTINSDDNNHIQAKLLYVAKSKVGTDWHSTVHSHYFTEFFYVLKGRGMFIVEENEFHVEENDFIIVNPGVSHTEKNANDLNFEYIVVGVDGISFNFNSEDAHDDYSLFHYKKDKDFIDFCLNALLAEMEKDSQFRPTVCQNLLELTIVNIIRKANYNLSVESVQSVNRACRAAKRYIDENFRNPITLEELATVAKVNKYYLSHTFSSDYKISPINYLIGRRIEECKNLLVSTNYSVSQIAGFTGFSSPSYFSQCFKRNTGLQPELYRKKFRMTQNLDNI